MSEKKKKDASRLHPETFFLPPLKMILAFFDKESVQPEKEKKEAEVQEKATEKDVEKLIEKLSEKDE
jgi:hypothetical protein